MSVPSLLSLSVTPDRECITVLAAGELDISNATDLEARIQKLSDAGWATVVLDLRGVTFMDSTGLRALQRSRRAMHARGRRVTIVDASDVVRRLFALTGMDQVMPSPPAVDAA
jgi:anti-sigma B factor antagonist